MFWFVGTVVCTIWFVFRDPGFDHRLLIVGAVLPALVDAPFGGARMGHSMVVVAALLVAVMLATPGRKPVRKMLLGLPIGMLLHLVFTGAWTDTDVFWWPVAGFGFADAAHPVAARGWWNVPLEVIGLGLCAWVVRRTGLGAADRRAWFIRTGQLVFDGGPAADGGSPV